jgi:large subunit ribosomal protein L15
MTHGKGKKGGRGAGLRGGKGNAGLNKHKFTYMIKYMPDHFGRHGFKRPQSVQHQDTTINVGQLEELFPGKKTINLTEAGYDKLLGSGSVTSSISVTVPKASERAISKIQEQGGKIKVEIETKENSTEQQSTAS